VSPIVRQLADLARSLGVAEDLARELAGGSALETAEAVRLVVREELGRVRAAAPADGLLSAEEAAELAGVKPATIRDWARSGRLATAGRAGRRLRFRGEAVEAALRSSASVTAVDLDREAGRLLRLDRARNKR